jgi:hypothetical protein
LTTAAK